jgi:hypothetical protein
MEKSKLRIEREKGRAELEAANRLAFDCLRKSLDDGTSDIGKGMPTPETATESYRRHRERHVLNSIHNGGY